MMFTEISKAIKEQDFCLVKNLLDKFNENHKDAFNFNCFDDENSYKSMWNLMFHCVTLDSKKVSLKSCLSCLRLLSRDKTQLSKSIQENHINILLESANLFDDSLCVHITSENKEVILEGLKCLCNIIYQCENAQTICCSNKTVDCLILRLRTYCEHDVPHDIKYFDIKLLFLLSAFNKEIRLKVSKELHGVTYLMEVLDNIIRNINEDSTTNRSCFNEENVSLSCEILKVLFNLTVNPMCNLSNDDDNSLCIRLVSILRDLLVTSTYAPAQQDNIISNVVNLLTNMPPQYLDHLMEKNHWSNVLALNVILDFLDNRLSTPHVLYENVSPTLIVLLKGSKAISKFRCFVRQHILPPLKDVMNRPEQGNTLRNKMCRLLTTPNVNLRDLVAELLFVLCKENVGRMIKYTGFGNSAGLFANLGLLNKTPNPDYSSDSEDSDTEEYLKYKDQINPVLGCFEPPKPNPFEYMSEEQQEHEVMQLVCKMDKLTREGVIQPCKIGDDGRPKPIEHVVQLQEELLSHFNSAKSKESPDSVNDY